MLSEKHIKQFAVFYCACFFLNFLWSMTYGLTFSSLEPAFFFNRLDFTGNLLMMTGLQHQIMKSKNLLLLFDVLYVLLPLLLLWFVLYARRGVRIVAFTNACFNLAYCFFFSSMSFISIEVFVSWMLVPLIFTLSPKQFYYNLHSLRIVFIVIFVSSALWKIAGGGIFNPDQMSGILLAQHAVYLVHHPEGMISGIIYFLVRSRWLSYTIYFLAFVTELFFIAGLFTKRFDRQLIALLMLFIFFDYLLMHINYFSWLVFAGCFYFSRLGLPVVNQKTKQEII